MKRVSKTLFVFSVLILFVLSVGPTLVYSQEKMSMDEYNAQLQEWQKRESDAKAEIAKLDADMESLKSQISDTESQTHDVWSDIYNVIGTDEAGVNAYRQQLDDLDGEINALAALSPEELFKKRKEIDSIEEQLNELKKSRISSLTEMQNKIAGLEGKIAQLRSKMPKSIYDEYTVVRGDYLWRISKKPDIYNDPFQWVRIYSYNRDQIKDPDLIYPEQIFKIQREVGPNEYLVSRGDNLAKIAGSMDILGDPTKWKELYEANKNTVGEDPGMIYPYQVLVVPQQ
ncbi:MAG: LysM peptidoglycan-binding domain-containing protein [bacterium]